MRAAMPVTSHRKTVLHAVLRSLPPRVFCLPHMRFLGDLIPPFRLVSRSGAEISKIVPRKYSLSLDKKKKLYSSIDKGGVGEVVVVVVFFFMSGTTIFKSDSFICLTTNCLNRFCPFFNVMISLSKNTLSTAEPNLISFKSQ